MGRSPGLEVPERMWRVWEKEADEDEWQDKRKWVHWEFIFSIVDKKYQ